MSTELLFSTNDVGILSYKDQNKCFQAKIDERARKWRRHFFPEKSTNQVVLAANCMQRLPTVTYVSSVL